MPFNILIVEDEELYADKLEMLLDKLGYEHLGTVGSSIEALQLIEQQFPDLIIMDIHIQGSHDGIELAELLQDQYDIPIIFITSLQDDLTFNRASRIKPLGFLIKPFNDLQLQRTIELTVRRLHEKLPIKLTPLTEDTETWQENFFFKEHFFIKTRQKLEKIAMNDVLYLEADGHYCQIHTLDKKYLVRIAMGELAKRLPIGLFLQTHRSFLVNKYKIQSIDLQDSVIVLEKGYVPLSKRSRELVLKELDWI